MVTLQKVDPALGSLRRYRAIDCALGTFIVAQQTDGTLRSFWMDDDDAPQLADVREDSNWNNTLFNQLRKYFAGKRTSFTAPTPPGPPFYQRCWDACRRIDPGEPISYGELAFLAGSPSASRAAGQAMRHNPLPIIVPCHRVVSSTGSLHGFAGSTDPDAVPMRRKHALLELERQQQSEPPRPRGD